MHNIQLGRHIYLRVVNVHFYLAFIYAFTNRLSGIQKSYGPDTYTATGENLSKEGNIVIFVGELVSYKVVHLLDANTEQA